LRRFAVEAMEYQKETAIQTAICDHLAPRRVFYWRQNLPCADLKRGIYYKLPKHTPRGIPGMQSPPARRRGPL
jgi:hypothetical protein